LLPCGERPAFAPPHDYCFDGAPRSVGADALAHRAAGAVDDRVVVVQDGCDVRSGEDRAELEGKLIRVCAGQQVGGGVRVAGGLDEQLAPLVLVAIRALVLSPMERYRRDRPRARDAAVLAA
jgi:hypothetical protein